MQVVFGALVRGIVVPAKLVPAKGGRGNALLLPEPQDAIDR
jgi:hypothetical protein